MRQIKPRFGKSLQARDVAPVLGLKPEDVDTRHPILEVSTGLPFIIVPLKALDAVRRSAVVESLMFGLVRGLEAKAVLLFCPETYSPENDLNVRVFAGQYGVPEDPATGSANGCLAAYLVKSRYFDSPRVDIRVEQGYEIGRPSLLLLKSEDKSGEINVSVGGRVLLAAIGELV
jgi:trans-2,3-dihydro-3-hydroxyanthranilate isomerase